MVKINQKLCTNCGNCAEACPFDVFEIKNKKVIVAHSENCKKCEACISACPNNAIKLGN